MNIRHRARVGALLAILVLSVGLLAARPAVAGDPRTGRIDLEASLDPADLAPGQSGWLVVKATLLPKLHIAATGETAMTYEPIEVPGVTYHMDTVELPPHHVWKDEMGDPLDVWEEAFTFKVKVTLDDTVAAGATLGMRFTYYGCNDRGCYPPVKKHEATVKLAGPAAALQTEGNGGGTAPPGIPADAGGAPKIVLGRTFDDGQAELTIDGKKSEAVVTFTPGFGWHMYGPDDTGGNTQVSVEPKKAEGVTWGEFQYPAAAKIEDKYVVRVPFERDPSVKEIVVEAGWLACKGDDLTGICAMPRKEELRAVWPGGEEVPPVEPAQPAIEPVPEGKILFPVVEDDDLGARESKIAKALRENLPLALLLIFVAGIALAFTPCVLPIIPITVSVISGGRADIPKPRLAALLITYVMGLSLTFATMGVIAALAGGAMSAAFANPAVIWGIAILFLLLAVGMLGIYELQAPSWMTSLQGGAQKRSGSFLGAFLFGMLGAVIASPCTGPAIAGLLLAIAQSEDAVLGFFAFLTLGLGMGAVLFAVGSLNFALRPGPWMVWVRYAFGVIMIGAALYFLASGGRIDQETLFIAGFTIAILAWIGIAWHLVKMEGEEEGTARLRGAKVAVLLIIVTGLVALLTRRPSNLLSWTYAKDPQHLVALVDEAKAEGIPSVVDFWGQWCTYCKKYDAMIAEDPDLRGKFERVKRIKVDLTNDTYRWDMRNAVGVKISAAPVLVFIDRKGRIRRKADLLSYGPAADLKKRIDLVLGE